MSRHPYTQLTLAALRKENYTTGVVERFLPWAGSHGSRVDLFGFIDIVAIRANTPILGVQSTGPGFHAHVKKLLVERREECRAWLATGHAALELWSWSLKAEHRGGRKKWTPRIREFLLQDFEENSRNQLDKSDESDKL